MGEIFRQIEGFPGYRVGNHGVVQSRWLRGQRRLTETWHDLKPIRLEWNYRSVNLHREGQKVTRRVHHLVLEAFVGPRPSGMVCCHYDGDPANNRLDNLRWDTPKANSDDKRRHGTMVVGERAPKAKLGEADVREIRSLHAKGTRPDDLASRFGVTRENIRAIVARKSWRHLA